jgi:hypothetical protein
LECRKNVMQCLKNLHGKDKYLLCLLKGKLDNPTNVPPPQKKNKNSFVHSSVWAT